MSNTTHPVCAHCGQPARGMAHVGDDRLCHPDSGMDCYHLVTVWGHQRTGALETCSKCISDKAERSRIMGLSRRELADRIRAAHQDVQS